MNNHNTWMDFWKDWRKKEIKKEEDLYYQVGRTVHQKPVPQEIFALHNKDICKVLSLNENDVLVDLCCGNGLCTYEFRNEVKHIIGIDFSEQMIDVAKAYKSAPNISYYLGDVLEFLKHFKETQQFIPTKFSMNGSLAYFSPQDLKTILTDIFDISEGKFTAFFTSVPCDPRKWNYYNTEERKQKYLQNVASGDFTNDGIGRWWLPQEITEICSDLKLQCIIINQQPPFSDFRMDIKISSI